MTMKIETLEVAAAMELFLAGAPLPVSGVYATVLLDDDPTGSSVVEVRLLAEMDFFNWLRVESSVAFGLDAAERGPNSLGTFDASRPVRVEARLCEAALPSLGAPEDPYDVAARLRSATATSPLRQSESWAVLAVTQEMQPGLRGGFASRPGR